MATDVDNRHTVCALPWVVATELCSQCRIVLWFYPSRVREAGAMLALLLWETTRGGIYGILVCVCTCMRVCACDDSINIYMCRCVCVCLCRCVCICLCRCIYMFVYVCMYVCVSCATLDSVTLAHITALTHPAYLH